MKRLPVFTLLYATFILFTTPLLAQTISSKSTGGVWNDPNTWQGGVVPTQNNDVIINGTVNATPGAVCRNLTVASGATLQNPPGVDITLTVSGNVTNNGSVRNAAPNWWLTLDVKGNIASDGTWSNHRTILSGSTDQLLSLGQGNSFDGAFDVQDTLGQMVASTALTIRDVFDLNRSVLNMSGRALSLEGTGNVTDGRVINIGDLYARNGAVVSNITYAGNVNARQKLIVGAGVTVEGNLTVIDTLQNDYGDFTFYVKGNLINNGVIQNYAANWWLKLDLAGNVTNNGVWAPHIAYLSSKSDQYLSLGTNKSFDGPFEVSDTSGKVIALTPLLLREGFDLNRSQLDLAGKTLTLEAAGNIYDGRVLNVADVYVRKGAIINEVTYVGSVNFREKAVVGNNVTVEGNVTVVDTLQNDYGDRTMFIKGNITNNGIVRNYLSNWWLYLNVTGNVTNNGSWTAYRTLMSSKNDQYLSLGTGKSFDGPFEVTDTTGKVIASSALTFTDWFDLHGSQLDMAGRALVFEKAGNITNGRVSNAGDITARKDAVISNVLYSGNMNLRGKVLVGGGVVMEGSVQVVDTLQNDYGDRTMTIRGSLTNNGIIQKWAPDWYLFLDISGNITNNGSWGPHETRLTGVGQRTVIGKTMQNPVRVTGSQVVLVGDNIIPSLVIENTAKCVLASGATLNLTTGVVTGSLQCYGKITASQKITTTKDYNYFAALANVVTGTGLDTLTIQTFGHQVPTTFANAVRKWWRISRVPKANQSTISSLRLFYDDDELGSNVESNLQAYHSLDSGKTWRQLSTSINLTRNPASNFVIITDVSTTGDVVLSSNPDPVSVRASVIFSVVGRPQIRVGGAPNRYTFHYVNNSDVATGEMVMEIKGLGGVHVKQVEPSMPPGIAKQIIPIDSLTYRGNKDSLYLWVTSMGPREERSLDVVFTADPDPGTKLQNLAGPTDVKIAPLIVAGLWYVGEALVAAYVTDVAMNMTEEIWRPVAPCETVTGALKEVIKESFRKTNKDWFGWEKPAKAVMDKASGDLKDKLGLSIPGEQLVEATGRTMKGAERYLSGDFKVKDCNGNQRGVDGDVSQNNKSLQKVRSWDPNEKVGPTGYGSQGFMSAAGKMTYQILFENKKEATAPAYKIVIVDTLQDVFDATTAEFGRTSHDGPNYQWKMTQSGNIMRWEIEGIELPPNVNPPEGEGYVIFTVQAKNSLASGAKLRNRATITFDANKPIATNEYVNTLDFTPPTTQMVAPPQRVDAPKVTVRWRSSDGADGAGVQSTTVYAAKDSGAYIPVGTTDADSLAVNVEGGRKYSFYALAKDYVGNAEQTRPTPVSTIVNPTTEVEKKDGEVASEFSLSQNYPNPFNPSTTITFSVPLSVRAILKVFDVLGREIATLVDEEKKPGTFRVVWDASRVSSGVYFYRLQAGDFVETRKLMLLK